MNRSVSGAHHAPEYASELTPSAIRANEEDFVTNVLPRKVWSCCQLVKRGQCHEQIWFAETSNLELRALARTQADCCVQ